MKYIKTFESYLDSVALTYDDMMKLSAEFNSHLKNLGITCQPGGYQSKTDEPKDYLIKDPITLPAPPNITYYYLRFSFSLFAVTNSILFYLCKALFARKENLTLSSPRVAIIDNKYLEPIDDLKIVFCKHNVLNDSEMIVTINPLTYESAVKEVAKQLTEMTKIFSDRVIYGTGGSDTVAPSFKTIIEIYLKNLSAKLNPPTLFDKGSENYDIDEVYNILYNEVAKNPNSYKLLNDIRTNNKQLFDRLNAIGGTAETAADLDDMGF